MKQSPHQRVDVKIFKEILKFNFNSYIEINKHLNLLEIVQKFNTIELSREGLIKNKEIEINKLNFSQYGFKKLVDFKSNFRECDIENTTTIRLIPNKSYILDDIIQIPKAFDLRGKIYIEFLSDVFERLKIKAEYILLFSEASIDIELYAKKNIQMAQAIFNDAKLLLQKAQTNNNQTDLFAYYIFNIFIVNTLMFYQKMFSFYFNEKTISNEQMKSELFDLSNSIIFSNYLNNTGVNTKLFDLLENFQIKWNGNINVLMTIIFELMNKPIGKLFMMDVDEEKLKLFLTTFVVDKNGMPLKRITIDTCLKSYREDKRAKGNTKIDIEKYFSN